MSSRPILYAAWFCPFAQRAWVSLLEKGVDFEYREHDPYNKTAEWLAINPRGLVPCLIRGNDIVVESLIISEYIDEAWPEKSPLYPPMSNPMERAKARIALDMIGKKVFPAFLTLHRSKDAGEKAKAVEALNEAIEEYFRDASAQGPFYYGNQFGIVDIAMAPFIARMEILDEFVDLKIFGNAKLSRFHTWWAASKERPSMKSSTSSRERFLQRYETEYFAGESRRTK